MMPVWYDHFQNYSNPHQNKSILEIDFSILRYHHLSVYHQSEFDNFFHLSILSYPQF